MLFELNTTFEVYTFSCETGKFEVIITQERKVSNEKIH